MARIWPALFQLPACLYEMNPVLCVRCVNRATRARWCRWKSGSSSVSQLPSSKRIHGRCFDFWTFGPFKNCASKIRTSMFDFGSSKLILMKEGKKSTSIIWKSYLKIKRHQLNAKSSFVLSPARCAHAGIMTWALILAVVSRWTSAKSEPAKLFITRSSSILLLWWLSK